jgi:hypothetical protein
VRSREEPPEERDAPIIVTMDSPWGRVYADTLMNIHEETGSGSREQ